MSPQTDQDSADILFFPPTLSILAPLLAIVLGFLFPLSILPPIGGINLLLGVGIMAGSGALAITATRSFSKAGADVNPKTATATIVRSGPFRFSRNPMYLAMILLQIGLALTFSLDWALLLAPALALALHFGVVRREEAYLTRKFGRPYIDYMQQVRRWF